MVESLDTLFGALADPTCRAILARLQAGEASAGELALPFGMAQPGASQHLRTLRDAGLVTARRDGTRRMFRLAPHKLLEIDRWLEDYRVIAEANYCRLDALLTKEAPDDSES